MSGGYGWSIWSVAPNGTASVVERYARRSGGNTSVLERAPDGTVLGESGSTLLELQGNRSFPDYSFSSTSSTQRPYFWLTFFAIGPNGTIYADEIPGGGGFERYQQLRVVRDDQSSLLWQRALTTWLRLIAPSLVGHECSSSERIFDAVPAMEEPILRSLGRRSRPPLRDGEGVATGG